MPQVGQDGSHFDENDWNDQIVEIAKSVPEDNEMRGRFVYMSSKVQSEKRAFEWMKERKVSLLSLEPFERVKLTSQNRLDSRLSFSTRSVDSIAISAGSDCRRN